MGKKYILFGGLLFIYYSIQFTMAVGACNHYSDTTRNDKCDDVDGSPLDGDKASEVFDSAI